MEVEVRKQVVVAVAQVLRKSEHEIIPDKSFAELGADELDMFELVLKFEDVFAIEIGDDDAARLHDVNRVVTYVIEKQIACACR